MSVSRMDDSCGPRGPPSLPLPVFPLPPRCRVWRACPRSLLPVMLRRALLDGKTYSLQVSINRRGFPTSRRLHPYSYPHALVRCRRSVPCRTYLCCCAVSGVSSPSIAPPLPRLCQPFSHPTPKPTQGPPPHPIDFWRGGSRNPGPRPTARLCVKSRLRRNCNCGCACVGAWVWPAGVSCRLVDAA
jgi:hypothetical protein